jgi:uncharacterized protein YggE
MEFSSKGRPLIMMRNRTWLAKIVLATVTIVACSTGARADESVATIVVSGRATVALKPQMLRMTLLITADGDDIRGATAKLQQQQSDLKSKLLAAGADESSIKFSDPVEGTDAGLTPQQRVIQQLQASSQREASGMMATTSPAGATVSSMLTAQWMLTDASAPDGMIAADDLESKIKAALPHAAPDDSKTPEEQEIAEETAAQQGENGRPTDPNFTFVHKLSDAERSDLYAQAFADAQAQAKILAAAAGKQLGAILRISTENESEGTANPYVEAMMEASGGAAQAADPAEATGAQRNAVTYSASLTATFKLQ